MAKQAVFEHEGKTIDFVNGTESKVAVGEVVPFASQIGVALEDIAPEAKGGVRLVGIWTLPAVNNAAFAVGDQLFWDTTEKKLTKVDSDTVPAGMCTLAKVASGTVASVKIG